uniref:Retrovirus-related Pol polyprotein LINE-1 n=1 Tax=Tanacetum cinerariifolium TaxID=118510 RepID=A0A6L2L2C9_TANCI|nr:retrovirus-related Pol polyprotein LINE-1 [Tanacetum cinerariifolium]
MVNCISCSDAYKALNALEVSLQVFSVVAMAIVVATKPGLISVAFRNTLVVGVMVAGRLKDDVVRVTKRSDRIMMISVVIDGEAVNVINAYAPHVALRDIEKKRLWDALYELVRECPADERLIIGGDLNGHIGATSDGYDGFHGGFGFGDKNEEGHTILEFATAHDMVVANSFYVLFERKRHRREAIGRPRILWKNLKGEAVETFRATVFEKLSALVEDMYAHNANQMWNTFAGVIRDVAKDSLCVASELARTHSTHRESWWFFKERCLEDEGVKWLTCLFNKIFLNAKMPDEWRLSEVIPIYKNKDDAQACSNYRGIKLLSHTMKLWERIIKRRLRTETMVLENQFGFMSGWSTTKEIHLLRILIEKYRERQRDLHFAFLDLEKACDSVSHDIVLIAKLAEELNNIIERYKVVHQEVDIHIRDQILQPKEYFRYLGSVIHRLGRIDEDVAHRIGVAQANRVEVAELRMLRWTYGVTMVDMIPNGVFRAELDVDSIIDKMREGRGIPKLRWEDRLKRDIKELCLSEDMTSDRNAWRDRIRIILVLFVCLMFVHFLGMYAIGCLFALLCFRYLSLNNILIHTCTVRRSHGSSFSTFGFILEVGVGSVYVHLPIPRFDGIGYVVVD